MAWRRSLMVSACGALPTTPPTRSPEQDALEAEVVGLLMEALEQATAGINAEGKRKSLRVSGRCAERVPVCVGGEQAVFGVANWELQHWGSPLRALLRLSHSEMEGAAPRSRVHATLEACATCGAAPACAWLHGALHVEADASARCTTCSPARRPPRRLPCSASPWPPSCWA